MTYSGASPLELPTRALARRFDGALRLRGPLACSSPGLFESLRSRCTQNCVRSACHPSRTDAYSRSRPLRLLNLVRTRELMAEATTLGIWLRRERERRGVSLTCDSRPDEVIHFAASGAGGRRSLALAGRHLPARVRALVRDCDWRRPRPCRPTPRGRASEPGRNAAAGQSAPTRGVCRPVGGRSKVSRTAPGVPSAAWHRRHSGPPRRWRDRARVCRWRLAPALAGPGDRPLPRRRPDPHRKKPDARAAPRSGALRACSRRCR